MKKIETNLLDCYILEPKRFGDERGFFESITREELQELGFHNLFQISDSRSDKGTIRGLHFQRDPYCQAKVVRCYRGAVYDIVVDLRKDSTSYKKWIGVELTPENGRLLYVPRGFAHGFVSLMKDTLFEYYVDNQYMPRMEGGILWNDPNLDINWDEILNKYNIKEPILSKKDKERCTLEECDVDFKRTPKKYFVTGVTGQLGYDIVRELLDRGEYDIYAPTSTELDITDREKVMNTICEYKPDVIFHCAAWTAVDKAQVEKEQCERVNVLGTKNIVDASLEVGAKIIYISTDFVYDGEKNGLYTEEDTPNPKNIYGQTKLAGEEEAKRNPNHFITRTSWVFGINGNNFIKTMLNLSDKYKEIKVVDDQIGTPTYTVDLARLLVEMAQTKKYGIYNVNNEGYDSKAEFAKYIMELNNKDTIINPISTDMYNEELYLNNMAPRPKNSKLDKTKLVENGFPLLPSWQDATERYCNELKQVKVLQKLYR